VLYNLQVTLVYTCSTFTPWAPLGRATGSDKCCSNGDGMLHFWCGPGWQVRTPLLLTAAQGIVDMATARRGQRLCSGERSAKCWTKQPRAASQVCSMALVHEQDPQQGTGSVRYV
jgi:hypothetical protein